MASPARPRRMPSRSCPLIKPLQALQALQTTRAPVSPALDTALRRLAPTTAARQDRDTANQVPDTVSPVPDTVSPAPATGLLAPDTAPQARRPITASPATAIPPRLAIRAATGRRAATTPSQERARAAEGRC